MTLFENAYNEVVELVRKFDEHKDQFISSKYQEAELRADFLDAFWTALGWDVRHREQTNPREQEVKIEKSDSVSFRKADYAFYLKPEYQRPVFLVEAKKPSEDLSRPEFYFQTARYGFNTATSVAVLTDFQEFHIIDCRRKPELVAGIVEATRLFKFTYQDYLDRDKFGEIYWKFSREAVAAGKLKEYWKSLKKPKGAAKQLKLVGDQLQAPDDLFLEDLDKYRKELASAFKSANKELNSQDLTEAAQKVLDRLVFIRFLQDKGIISDFIIEKFTSDTKGSAWKSFIVQSQKLEKDFNGVVFKEHFIDRPTFAPPKDDRFSLIADEFSHKRSPYLFSYIPVEILGSIYERFLGKVVVPKGSGIAVEEKPEVRKAGGVYYTPKYIVDYIVANTVGKILNGTPPPMNEAKRRGLGGGSPGDAQTSATTTTTPPPNPLLLSEEGEPLSPKEVAKLRFADIACGSGSFLIAIFDAVNTHLERWYSAHPEEAIKDGCRVLEPDEQGRPQFSLSLEQKRGILQNNIFGVDIDSQAVEVAQFSLFLKLLESETIASVQLFSTPSLVSKKVSKGQLTFHHGVNRKILPDLSKNIQCGNSLVEYDISDLFPLTAQEELKIKPFSFSQAFRHVMDNGGFDAIVGNPPYRSLLLGKKRESESETLVNYFQSRYPDSATYKLNLFALFAERCMSLLRREGLFSYIIPDLLFTSHYFSNLRKLFIDSGYLSLILDLRYKVFAQAEIGGNGIFTYQQSVAEGRPSNICTVDSIEKFNAPQCFSVQQAIFYDRPGFVFLADVSSDAVRKRIENVSTIPLGDLCTIYQGIITGNNKKFLSESAPNSKWKKILRGRDFNRYELTYSGIYVYYDPEKLWSNTNPEMFKVPEKLISRQTSDHLVATYDSEGYFTLDSTHVIHLKRPEMSLKFLLAIYNSRLLNFLYTNQVKEAGRTFAQVKVVNLKPLPIRRLDLNITAEKKLHDEACNLVDQLLAAKKQVASARNDSEREQFHRKCDYLDGEIDKLVYQLYDLTDEEIRIVEGMT